MPRPPAAHDDEIVTFRRIQLAVLLALVPLAAACGGVGMRDALSIDPVANAATKTSAAQSMRVAFDGSISGPWAGQQFGFTGNGAVDGASLTGEMHFRFNFPSPVSAQLDTEPSMDMIFESKHGFVAYMRSPRFP